MGANYGVIFHVFLILEFLYPSDLFHYNLRSFDIAVAILCHTILQLTSLRRTRAANVTLKWSLLNNIYAYNWCALKIPGSLNTTCQQRKWFFCFIYLVHGNHEMFRKTFNVPLFCLFSICISTEMPKQSTLGI